MNGGRWQKGQSGNPGGRPREDAQLRALARECTGAALDTLTAIMGDAKATAAARVSAACAILDRGYGRPAQELQHSGPGGEPVTLEQLVSASMKIREPPRS